MGLKITSCTATPSSINIAFSDALNKVAAEKPGNYTIQPIGDDPITLETSQYNGTLRMVTVTPSAPVTTGTWLTIKVKDPVVSAAGAKFDTNTGGNTIAVQVNGEAQDQTIASVEDAVTYPVLTEEIGYPSSPAARGFGGGGAAGAAPLGQMVSKALGDVLGWKVRSDDAKGFMGALTTSFTGTDVEGHTEWTWTPRTYAVQTDLSGGITGAQASIYSRAQVALDKSLPLLDGLYSLDTEADPDDVAALKALARSQLTELVNEFPFPGGPRVSRVNQYFLMLLFDPPAAFPPPVLQTEPDVVGGTLGRLRNILGLKLSDDRVNTVEEEQNLTNFRILSDYVTSLAQTWINNQEFFGLDSKKPFFGTQLVLLSRQLSVIAESIDEVNFALDSVFIGPAERQTLKLNFGGSAKQLFAEDLFSWIRSFAVDEGPRIIQEGGKLSIKGNFLPVAKELHTLVDAVDDKKHHNEALPRGFHTARVQRALQELAKQLKELVDLAKHLQRDSVDEPSPKELQQAVAVTTEAHLVAFPPAIHFGAIKANSSKTERVTLINLSSQITYDTITSETSPNKDNAGTDHNTVSVAPELAPNGLGPMQACIVKVTFTPPTVKTKLAADLVLTASYKGVQQATQTIVLKGSSKD